MNEALTAYVSAFIDELIKLDVNHVVISPGSRSTPFALLMAENQDMNVWLNLDERSAAFFALGMAKASRKPVALVCTSGTAAANYYPAIVEAKIARVPLLILTADRPHELRDVGAPQAIDQLDLYGKHVKTFIDMALPDNSSQLLRYVRTMAGRAVAISKSSISGPVHLNFPFREPLIPNLTSPNLWDRGRNQDLPYVRVEEGERCLSEKHLKDLAEALNQEKGIIICGPIDQPGFKDAVVTLAEVLSFPILADPLSQLRSDQSENIIDCYDTFLRDDGLKDQLGPGCIIRFGAMPVSKSLLQFLDRHHEIKQIMIDESEGWRDPTLTVSEMIYANPVVLCQQLAPLVVKKAQSPWLSLWHKVNQATKQVMLTELSNNGDELFEGKVIPTLAEILPHEATLFVGNSMPIRDVDSFYFKETNKQLRIMANRGANGIDGVISAALGASTVCEPLVLLIGDLSFFHDLNGLLVAKQYNLNMTIILINNDGGGIFSFLPQAKEEQHFEQLFGTATGLDFEHVVTMYAGTFTRIHTWAAFGEKVNEAIKAKGIHVIEVPTDRSKNTEQHRQIWNKAVQHAKLIVETERLC